MMQRPPTPLDYPRPRVPHYEIYADAAGEWRWRLRAANGRIIADGGEGYASARNVKRAIPGVASAAARAKIIPISTKGLIK